MKKVWTVVLLCGVACFVVGAGALALGLMGMEIPENHSIPAVGLILIAAGCAGQKKSD